MKLNSHLRLVSLVLALAFGTIVFISATAEGPRAIGATPPESKTAQAPCGNPNPVSKFASNPPIIELDTTKDIFVVGDAHADPDRLAAVLEKAQIIGGIPATPNALTWTAGQSVVVVTGDMIDKGPSSLSVIALLRALQTAAASKGGQVIITMGNHEAEFLADPHGKKTTEFGDELRKSGYKRNDVASCQGDLGAFLCGLPIAARVNDWFFSHAGNTNGKSIGELNAAIARGICQKGFAATEIQNDNSILEARLNDKGPGGLPWFDNGKKTTDPQTLLESYVKALAGVNHLVQGHQPGKVAFPDGVERNKYDLFQRYGLLFLIDGGMSQGVSGNKSIGGVLHITRRMQAGSSIQTVKAICAGGETTALWDSQANQQGPIALHCSPSRHNPR